jgi:hypothetical protein
VQRITEAQISREKAPDGTSSERPNPTSDSKPQTPSAAEMRPREYAPLPQQSEKPHQAELSARALGLAPAIGSDLVLKQEPNSLSNSLANSPVQASFIARTTDEVMTRLIEILKLLPENPITAPLIKFLEQSLLPIQSLPPVSAPNTERKVADSPRGEEVRRDKDRKDDLIFEYGKELLKNLNKKLTDNDVLEVAGFANEMQSALVTKEQQEDVSVTVHRLTGYVYSAATGLPIAGATIKAGFWGTATTGLLGDFAFDNIPEGSSFSVSVSKAFYQFNSPTKSGIIWNSVHLEFSAVAEPQTR